MAGAIQSDPLALSVWCEMAQVKIIPTCLNNNITVNNHSAWSGLVLKLWAVNSPDSKTMGELTKGKRPTIQQLARRLLISVTLV